MRSILILLLALVAFPAFADDDSDCHVVAVAFNPTEAGGTNDFVNLVDSTIGTTDAAEDHFVLPVDAVAKRLFVEVDVAPGGTDQWDINVMRAGTGSGLNCTILGTATSCNDTDPASWRTFTAGQDSTIQVISSLGASDPDAAAEMKISFCFDMIN